MRENPGSLNWQTRLSYRRMMCRPLLCLGTVGILIASTAAHALAADPVVNSLGIKMLPIAAGEFTMGSVESPPPTTQPANPPAGLKANWDEAPLRHVTISHPFLMAETEVTAEQYHQFKPDAPLTKEYAPYAAGMSWFDAVSFCAWLSQKEGKNYRLPTEAEWEYACRAGRADGTTWEAKLGEANPWGLKDMLSGPMEWCSDWYGEYDFPAQIDPVGMSAGFTKVVRGGYLDTPEKFKPDNYLRPAARSAIAPSFGPYADGQPNPKGYGMHRIGIRLVQADPPTTAPLPFVAPYVRQGVKLTTTDATGPDMAKPYFHRRRMLPIPPEDEKNQAVVNHAGLHPSFRFHEHSPGFEVLPNGDTLLVIYTSYFEYEPEVSLIAARLRAGAEEWDMPSTFMDTAGANDHAPLLKQDGNTLRLFWGNPYAEGHFPFQTITSTDMGATWSAVNYPHITGPLGPVLERPQPINTFLRDAKGTIYVPVDGGGGAVPGVLQQYTSAHSMLWASDDNGLTWRDTQGRTFGRHTTFVLGKDGSTIIGYGGKNSSIDSYMPKSVSKDGGKTYEYSKTPFAQLNSGQRPCLIRLNSGRLFIAADFQPSKGAKPATITQQGSFVALSDDEGQTWHVKQLPGAESAHRDWPSLGYCVARQQADGMINLITSLNHPAMHFQFNEAWVLSDAPLDTAPTADQMDGNTATSVKNITQHQETYPDGKPRITWSSGVANDGRIVLEGRETWFYADGTKQHETGYHLGVKTGQETYWAIDGKKQWEWNHHDDGVSVWTTYWSDGTKRSESSWKNHELITGSDQFYEHPTETK